MRYAPIGLALTAGLAMGASGALAQTSGSGSSGSANQSAQHGKSSTMTQEKLRQSLTQAGFQDVRIVDASYLVQAKTKDGDTVVMMINPPDMTGSASSSSSSSSSGRSSGSTGSSSSK